MKIIRSPWLYFAVIGGIIGFGVNIFAGNIFENIMIAALIGTLVGGLLARITKLEESIKVLEDKLQMRTHD